MPHTNCIDEKKALFFKILFLSIDSIRTGLFNYLKIHFEFSYLFSLLCFILFALIFYEAKFSTKLFFSTIYLAILFAADTIASTLFQFFSNQQISASFVGGPLRLPITLIYISCMAALVFISHFVKWKIYSLSPIETVSYIIICVIGFFFGQYIVSITLESFEQFADINFTNKLIIISSIYCILFLVLLAYIYVLNYTKEINKKLLEDKQQLLLEEADYKNLIETTDSLRKLKHDMQHHLSTIQYYAQQNNIKELINYVSKYIGTLNNMHKFISTGNSAIDCILSISISKAEAKGIAVSSTLTVPDTFNLDSILTASLLGNLWINAIDACEKLVSANKYAAIDFYIKPFENMLLISIENTYDGFNKKDSNGNYISTKNGINNGIGLKRINEIVKQNDGIIEITDTENLFCVHIMFPLEEKKIL